MQKKRLTNWRNIHWQGIKARSQESFGTNYANEMAAAWGHNLWGQSRTTSTRRNLSWENSGNDYNPKAGNRPSSGTIHLTGFGKLNSTLHLFTIFLFVFSVGLSLGILLLLIN